MYTRKSPFTQCDSVCHNINFYRPQRGCGKVMFSRHLGFCSQRACMIGGGGGGGLHGSRPCMAGGAWQRGCAWQGGMCGMGVCGRGCAWQERWPLQRLVCISYWNAFLFLMQAMGSMGTNGSVHMADCMDDFYCDTSLNGEVFI